MPKPHPIPARPLIRSRQALFRGGDGGYVMYRIPVLFATARGTLLATCEARQGAGDWTETHVLLRRSVDAGATWDAPRRLCATPADAVRNRVSDEHPDTTRTQGFVHHNCVILPGAGATTHAIFGVEYERMFHRVSSDDGATWGAPIEITAALAPLRRRYPWRVCAAGPGHGLRLRTGRLLVPVWLSVSSGGHGHRPSVVVTLMSDDDGASWRASDLLAVDGDHAVDGARVANPSEATLVEMPDGRVLMSLRSESAPHRRLHLTSADGGVTFDHPRFCDGLYDAVCAASMLPLGGRLLFCAPDPRDAQGRTDEPNARRRLLLSESCDGSAWHPVGLIEGGITGYSHLATHGGRTWCLFESGSRGETHFHTSELALAELAVGEPGAAVR
ncbi:MAG TPA: sialidase family protein [Planctomycetota bacterium]|nr:sialidase family protein [Planctomycetota bacterium]